MDLLCTFSYQGVSYEPYKSLHAILAAAAQFNSTLRLHISVPLTRIVRAALGMGLWLCFNQTLEDKRCSAE